MWDIKYTNHDHPPLIVRPWRVPSWRPLRYCASKTKVYVQAPIPIPLSSSGTSLATTASTAAAPFGSCSMGEMTMFQLTTVMMTVPRAKRQKMRCWSNGKGWRCWMDQAKMVEAAVGPVALASEPSIIDSPLTVPRLEGSTALLIARAKLITTFCCEEMTDRKGK